MPLSSLIRHKKPICSIFYGAFKIEKIIFLKKSQHQLKVSCLVTSNWSWCNLHHKTWCNKKNYHKIYYKSEIRRDKQMRRKRICSSQSDCFSFVTHPFCFCDAFVYSLLRLQISNFRNSEEIIGGLSKGPIVIVPTGS